MDAFGEGPIWALPSPSNESWHHALCYMRVVFNLAGASPLGGFLEMLPKRLGVVVQSPARAPGALGLFGMGKWSYDKPVVRESYENDK